ncbi:hypothetical protein [Glycomyces harbinensis]|uniref:tRNA nuclease CdiA C-terminal domain-containing protein n=1 Tax=Glycomyces harbinensis TaxID=58114 RepID=A0A1G6R3Q5_9ACTN|nr:hypothetical protein [Glycomyces harbinensis]SDC99279.1 hypothetical protein SAMN05216270_101280 [Glycomyces harbinensis]
MSLLSELVEQLRALTDDTGQTRTSLDAVRTQLGDSVGFITAATVGSSSPLVPEGVAQWQAALDRLDEARANIRVGDEAMNAYIALLGGGHTAAPGNHSGGASPGPPPQTSSPTGEPGGERPPATPPRFAPDSARRPRGEPANADITGGNPTDIRRENEAAKVLAEAGYDIEQNPPSRPNGKAPDYMIDGQWWDCYSPTGSSTRTIHTSIRNKVGKSDADRQADRIILNLDGCGATAEEIRARLERSPIRGLQEIKVVKGGKVTQFYPWDTEAAHHGD